MKKSSSNRVVKNLSEVPAEERIQFLSSVDTILMDCDGVIWHRSGPIEGSGQVVQAWRKLHKHIYFVSNNSTKTADTYRKNFEACNIAASKAELIYPSLSIAEYLKTIKFTKTCFLVVTSAFQDVLVTAGFKVCKGSTQPIEEGLSFVMNQLRLDDDIGAVILDVDLNMTYLNLMNCVELLKRPNMLFIVGATDRRAPLTPTFHTIGPGYFMDILISMTGKEPIILGKPGKELADVIKTKCKITNTKKALFIGDALDQDIGFGNLCGFKTLLVLSGGTSRDDLTNCDNERFIPDYYIDSIGDLLPIIQSIPAPVLKVKISFDEKSN